MLPSKGLFSSIPCLLYLSGNCQRPYCHYRHCARDKPRTSNGDEDRVVASSSIVTDDESSSSSLPGKLIKDETTKASTLPAQDEPAWPGSKFTLSYVTKLVEKLVDRIAVKHLSRDQLVEITLAKLQEGKAAASKGSESELSCLKVIKVPAYEPTPISELNKRHIPVACAPEKPVTMIIRKAEEKINFGAGSVKNINEVAQPVKSDPISSVIKSEPQPSSYDPKTEAYTAQGMNSSAISYYPKESFDAERELLRDDHDGEHIKDSQSDENLLEDVTCQKQVKNGLSDYPEKHLFTPDPNKSEHRCFSVTPKATDCGEESNHVKQTTDEALWSLKALLSGDLDDDHDRLTGSVEDKLAKLFHDDKANLHLSESAEYCVVPKITVTKNEKEVKMEKHREKHVDRKHRRKSSSSDSSRHRRKSDDSDKASHSAAPSISSSRRSESSSRRSESSSRHSNKHRSYSNNDKCREQSRVHSSKDKESESNKKRSSSKMTSSSSKDIKISSHVGKGKESIDDCHSAQLKRSADEIDDAPPSVKKAKLTMKHEQDESWDYDDDVDAMETDTEDCTIVNSCVEAITIPSSESEEGENERCLGANTAASSMPTSSELGVLGTIQDRRWTLAKEKLNKSIHGKVRIASVPNVNSLLLAKSKLLAKAKQVPATVAASIPSIAPTQLSTSTSIDEPVPTTKKRVARNQDVKKTYPSLIGTENSKIPLPVRQRWCNQFYDNLSAHLDANDAMKMASEEEHKIALRCNLIKTYNNNCSLLILKIRKTGGQLSSGEPQPQKLSANCKPDYTYGWTLYECFEQYVLEGDDLATHGYPLPLDGQPGQAFAQDHFAKKVYKNTDNKFVDMCENCSKTYEIDEHGMPTTSNDCHYHWGKLRKTKLWGQWTERFTCCQGDNEAPPCQSAMYHVRRGSDEERMSGFVQTRPFPATLDDSLAGVVALDCEMCYTTKGLELGRLSVVDLNEQLIFDEVVAMERPVLDYCTRFSGLDESKMKNATYTFDDVRKWFLDHIYDKTIIIGHSLENDLKVLKIFHYRIVDTSVTFPHKFGPPYRTSLKTLARTILNIAIQEDESGHDSKEDAVACLRLMIHKIKEDSKIRKPRTVYGYSGKT